MRYVIFNIKNKYILGYYEYYRPSNVFICGFGTKSYIEKHYDDISYEIVAEISYNIKEFAKFLVPETYPEYNVLTIKLKDNFSFCEQDIKSMKGFKKFFGHMNIKQIKILNNEKI